MIRPVKLITSLDGAAFFDGVAGPLSNPTDQNLLLTLRGYADVILVGDEMCLTASHTRG
jgi:hypothetical protein